MDVGPAFSSFQRFQVEYSRLVFLLALHVAMIVMSIRCLLQRGGRKIRPCVDYDRARPK